MPQQAGPQKLSRDDVKLAAARLLLKHGASLESRFDSGDEQGMTIRQAIEEKEGEVFLQKLLNSMQAKNG